MESYSVLMSVYAKEKAQFLKDSVESMLNQTVCTNDFVLVCDGPLTSELEDVITEFQERLPSLFHVIRLPQNLGIGGAANEGLKYCKNDLVAKMDSDDIALCNRCEQQLKQFEIQPDLSILGTQLAEFEDVPENIVARRIVPLTHGEIITWAKRRMPFNNQTLMYRKQAVVQMGGYSQRRRCEDYELCVRLLRGGMLAANLDEVLVLFRLTKDAYKRRGMFENLKGFISVRWDFYKSGFSSFFDFLIPCLGQIGLTIVPGSLKNWIYLTFLRAK